MATKTRKSPSNKQERRERTAEEERADIIAFLDFHDDPYSQPLPMKYWLQEISRGEHVGYAERLKVNIK